MKTPKLLCAVVLACAFAGCRDNEEAKPESPRTPSLSSADVVLGNIATRVSVRRYVQGRPVPEEMVEKILRAGMAAPTAVNRQPWEFVVVTDRAALDELSTADRGTRMLASAPLAIVVCGRLDNGLEDRGREFWIQDCSAATENMLLAAHALGLGAVWTAGHPLERRTSLIRRVAGLPGDVEALCVIAIGWPEGDEPPKDKWKPEKVHYERY